MHRRREFLARLGGAWATLLLGSACGAPAPGGAPTAGATTGPAAATTVQRPSGPAAEATASPAAAAPRRGGVLLSALSAEPPTLDPHLGFPNVFSSLLYDRLVIFDRDNRPRPALAESWEIKDDGATFVFKLRPGVRFHNGREVVAADVKYSFERTRVPPSPFAADYAAIQNLEVLDPATVRLSFGKPFPGVFKLLAQFTGGEIVPREAVEQYGDLARNAVGTGPFMLDRWLPGSEITLKRNPSYYRPGLPYLDGISFKLIPDEAGAIAALRAGSIHHFTIVEYATVRALEQEAGVRVYRTPRVQSSAVAMYLNGRFGPLADPKVREAIYWTFDRDAAVKIATAGLGVATGPIAPSVPDWALPTAEVAAFSKRDLPRARRAAEEALASGRYPDGLKTEVWADAATRWRLDSAQILAANCKEIGIQCDVVQMETGVLTRRFLNREAPIYPNSWGGSALDPDAMYRFLHSQAQDYLYLRDPEIDRLLDEGRYTWDPARRKVNYDRVQRLLLERHAGLWLYHIDYYDAARADVTFTRELYPAMFARGLEETWIA